MTVRVFAVQVQTGCDSHKQLWKKNPINPKKHCIAEQTGREDVRASQDAL